MASHLIDLGGSCQIEYTLGSGVVFAASGGTIGKTVDLLNADGYCNVLGLAMPVTTSGQLRLQVQVGDAATSGSLTDPTSGLPAAALPQGFSSGGIIFVSSGGGGGQSGGVLNGAVSGQYIASGVGFAAGFIRIGRYARVNVVSGDFYNGSLAVALVSQYKTTGSGAGFSLSPGSGSVSV